MDSFKFRVFDTVTQEYLNMPLYISNDGKLYDKTLEDGWFDKRYTIERCSGFKDKNGKLIYAGDIVQRLICETTLVKEKVVYEDGCFFTKDLNLNAGWLLSEDSNHVIIGNIHKYKGEEKWKK